MALYNDAEARAANFDKSATSGLTTSVIILCGLFGALVILAVVITTITTSSITKPLREIEEVAGNIAKGKLNNEIHYHSKDEVGRLADSFRTTTSLLSVIINDVAHLTSQIAKGNFDIRSTMEKSYIGDYRPILLSLRDMTTQVSGTMNQINQSADQVSSGSDQVSSGAQALSQGATEQASAVQELAATINNISSQIRENAEHATKASRDANTVGTEMTISNEKMQDMIKAMEEISHSSSEIGKIIKTIEDIAFQTNILALNAAVEAARAGAAGKGFAVVADEVRSLATKSQEASKNTAALIESSIRAVENGTHIAGETEKSLLESVEGVKLVTETINKISVASSAQAEAVAQVTQGVEQISSVVQTNSATAEESAAASEELSSQAQILKELINRFALRSDGHSVSSYSSEPAPTVSKDDNYSISSGKYE